MDNNARDRDLRKQGIMKLRNPYPNGNGSIKARVKELKAAIAGKRGYQSDWAITAMKQEIEAITKS